MKFLYLLFIILFPFLLFAQGESQEVNIPKQEDTIQKRHLFDYELTYLGFGLNFAKSLNTRLSLGAGIGSPYYFGILLTPNHYVQWNNADLENRQVVDYFRGRIFLRHYTLPRLVLEGGLRYSYTALSLSDYCEPCYDQLYGAEIAIIYGKRAVKFKSSFSFLLSNYDNSFFIL